MSTTKRAPSLPAAPADGFAALAWAETPCADPEFDVLRDDVERNGWLGWTSGIYAITGWCARCDQRAACDAAMQAERLGDGIAGGHVWIGGERRI